MKGFVIIQYLIRQKMASIIFFSVVILVYGLANYYIFIRDLQALPFEGLLRIGYIVVFWALALTFVAGRILERVWLGPFSDVLVWIGSFWLGAMLYFFLITLLFDILRLVNAVFHILPPDLNGRLPLLRPWLLSGSILVVFLLLTAGFINAINPHIKTVNIHIQKNAGGLTTLNAVLMSDLHLGTIMSNDRLENIVRKANDLNPDIILLAGDILDEDLAPVIRQNLGYSLKNLEAKLGVFGVMGNHEYIGGSEPAYRYLSGHGVLVLRDSVVKIAESFYLIGREDFQKRQFVGRDRKPLDSLMQSVNTDFPVFVLDHQPFHPDSAARSGVDLMLSGHTHHGQLWPINFITRAIYVVSHGYSKIENMHLFVSNGVGTWGPPIRIGNRPEIVQLKIKFGVE